MPNAFSRKHFDATATFQKVILRNLERKIERYVGEAGFERIAQALGIPKPLKQRPIRVKGQRGTPKIKGVGKLS